jgi:hypothetical protein
MHYCSVTFLFLPKTYFSWDVVFSFWKITFVICNSKETHAFTMQCFHQNLRLMLAQSNSTKNALGITAVTFWCGDFSWQIFTKVHIYNYLFS